jgi:hypothetical protein
MKESLKNYFQACEQIRKDFVEKYIEYDDSCWIGNQVGGLLSFSDQFIDMSNMVKVIELNMTQDEFFDWYHWTLDYAHEQKTPPMNIWNFTRQYRENKERIPGFERNHHQMAIPA